MLACSFEFKQVAVSSVACLCTHMSSGYFLYHSHFKFVFSPDEGWSSQPKR